MSDIPFIDLAAQQNRIRAKIDRRLDEVLRHGNYILGPEVQQLERELAQFSGVKHAITCGNGTDALLLALMALEIRTGDAVFCPSFTFAATAEVVPCLGATPFFVDVDENTFNLDPNSLRLAIGEARAIGLRPRCIIPVDLFGLPADYKQILEIAENEKLSVLADSAQGYGGAFHGQKTGSIGDIATTSFFPAKPLGCYGDGGALFTNDDHIAEVVISYRFHGKGADKYDNERIGMNSRLDTFQAAILLEKLAIYPDELSRRNKIAGRYSMGIKNDCIQTPFLPNGYKSAWAQYTLKAPDSNSRSIFMEALKKQGIPSVIYYPVPLHKQTAYRKFPRCSDGLATSEQLATQVFSIPFHPYLSESLQDSIIDVINNTMQQ
ncbi:DegT/DnrJ/EryC1/StrS aminotransferase family protein [Alphaproteobacteria bacterium]|nr:DegT/DnrJ/EryC1/StrS aminotransferase family protein [Alphaproteobacteria bacterium]